MAHLTIEFHSVADLRTKLAQYNNDLRAENLDPYDRAAIQAFSIKFIPMPLWLRGSLNRAGINTLGQLSEYTAEAFLALPGLAEKSLEQVNTILLEYGLSELA